MIMLRIRNGDYILVTDETHKRYLQIGEIVDIDYYAHSDCIFSCKVKFADGIDDYDWHFDDCFRRLILERN